ncbi:putative TonB-dependent receptor precursor [Halomonas elongata]|uniref:Putative TonB-dependent receptor n=1 Tax=Halomonas elongata TaxID=2746 RepID=A0A1B8P125_HALEL|nr:putative TonB-dependent receptor precursor [Halomonas elongata]
MRYDNRRIEQGGEGHSRTRKWLGRAWIVLLLTVVVVLKARGQEEAGGTDIDAPLAQQIYTFDLPEQRLLDSLGEFTATTGIAVLRADGQAIEGMAPAIRGEMTAEQALHALLAGASLSVEYRDERTVELVEPQTVTTVGDQVSLSTLTVLGNRSDWTYYTPGSVSVISREQIDRMPPRHAADMLVETPGVYSAVSAQDPGLSVNIRGMQDFGRVNMMIDGMRQNFNENAHQQRNGNFYVDSELLSSVEIDKGPSSGVHGATAIAGSADFQTISYDDIILPGNDAGVRLRGTTGVGGDANGVHFIGSAAVAGRLGDNLELLAAKSRRSFGEYAPGKRHQSYDWLTAGVQDNPLEGEQELNTVKFTDNTQNSELFKARLGLPADQALEFTWLHSQLDYNNTSDRRSIDPITGEAAASEDAYTRYGDARAESESFGLDYYYQPESPWFDLHAKLYFVDTRNRRNVGAGRPVMAGSLNMTDYAWDNGYCESPSSEYWITACDAGLGSTTDTRIKTYGFTLENTSRFSLAGIDGLSFNHGLEYFQDRGDSESADTRNGSAIDSAENTLQPNGKRSTASAFGNLTWENETWTLSAGLRYDDYRLNGETTVPGTEWTYQDREDRFRWYAEHTRPVREGEMTYEEYVQDLKDQGRYEEVYNRGKYDPAWQQESTYTEYDVDEHQQRWLPTLAAAYRPTDWLEFFAGWGKSWRPPGLTESLMEGQHPGDPFATMYPNPYAEPETSRSWEVGFNTTFEGLLTPQDRLLTKLAYYDTRVDNYLITNMANVLPGQVGGLGNTMFINNLAPMKFQGIELELDYDAGPWYTRLAYTHVLNDDQDFCFKTYPLGSGWIKEDQLDEDGNYSDKHNQAIEEGYDSYEDKLDHRTQCGTGGEVASLGMNSARNSIMDRGTWVLGTRLFDRKLDIGTRLTYSAEGKPKGFDTAIWPSYTVWDLYASYRFNQHVILRGAVNNLRDESYVTGYSDIFSRTYAPGRTVMAGLEVQF